MDIRGRVGFNVQRLRREREISQEELSLLSGCTRAYLSGVEAGRRNATLITLAKIAKALEVDVTEFFLKPPKRDSPVKRRTAGAVPSGRARKATRPRE
jgi:transcriptional regulator with XRE-family HTH domain